MGAPLISVIMPVFNAGIFLRPALASVLAQTLGDFEFLVVDDGSADGSRRLLAELTDPRFRVSCNDRNLGVAATRNRALAEARGEFVAFLNHDDVALPERFARQVAFLRAHPATMLLGTGIETFDGEGRRLPATVLPADDAGIRWMGLLECPLRQSTLMVRRDFLNRAGLQYDPAFQAHADYDFVMRAVHAGVAANLPETLVHYRRHAGSLSLRGRTRLIAEGNRIAAAAIARALPGHPLAGDDVALVRAVVLGYTTEGTRRSLAETKRGWELYFQLLEAFREKFGPAAAVSAPSEAAAQS
jgi:glycosyltransferase involved in cell wall biosynthesis